MVEIYKSAEVKALQEMYGSDLFDHGKFLTIGQRLNWLAEVLIAAYEDQNPVSCIEISNHHPDYLGMSSDELLNLSLDSNVIRDTIANEYGFSTWAQAEKVGQSQINWDFEYTLNHLLNGDLPALIDKLGRQPELVSVRSQYGHGASLLHYVGSNGVEIWRQQVPLNLAEATKYLFLMGMDPNQTFQIYGSDFDTKSMISTSTHPSVAGIAEELLALFE